MPASDNTSASQHKRVLFISYLQSIGIILVVLGHSLHEYPVNHGIDTLVYRMIYSFHMPLFMLASGYLLSLTYRHRSFAQFAGNKIGRLIIPFITLTLVTFVPRSLMSGMADDPVPLTVNGLCLALIHGDHLVFPYLWFPQALFILLIICGLILNFSASTRIPTSIAHIFILLLFGAIPLLDIDITNIFSLHRALHMGIFFATGMAYCHWQTAIDRTLPWTSWWFTLLCGAIWIALFNAGHSWLTGALTALAGTAMCISVSKLLVARHVRWLDHLTGANYIIFLLSWYMNVAFQQVLHHFVELPWWVYSALSIIAGIYVPWLALQLMIRHKHRRPAKIAAMLLGQKLPD